MTIRSILVVDDCDLSQMVSQMEIEQFDPSIEVHEAFDGMEALSILRELPTPPDLILLDINMPGMNGHDFLAAYSTEFTEHCKVAMISSSDLATDRNRCASYPFVHHYFVKPLCQDHLNEAASLLRVEATQPTAIAH